MADRSVRVTLSAIVAPYVAGMGKAAASTRALGKDIVDTASRADRQFRTLRVAGLAVGAGIGGGLIAASKSAVDFESSMAGVRKTLPTGADFKAIEEGIRGMARELPASHDEIARVAEVAGQLGISSGGLLEFTRRMIDLGESVDGLTTEEAATGVARLMGIMGTAEPQVGNLSSSLVALGNDGKSTEAQILDMGTRIAGAGHAIGLTEGDVLGIANALSSVGIEAEAGGSAISTVMIDLAKAVSKGGDKLALFARVSGQTTAEFKQAWQDDAAGALVSFVEGLGQLNQGDLFAVMDKLGLDSQRVGRALLNAAGAGDEMRRSIDLGNDAFKDNTALTNEASQRYGTTAAKLEVLRNNVVDLGIGFGQFALPGIKAVTDGLASMTAEIGDLPGPARLAAGGLLTVGGGASAALAGLGFLMPKIQRGRKELENLGRAGQLASGGLGFLSRIGGTAVGIGALVFTLKSLGDSLNDVEIDLKEVADATDRELAASFARLAGSPGPLDPKWTGELQQFNQVLEESPSLAQRIIDALKAQGENTSFLQAKVDDHVRSTKKLNEALDDDAKALSGAGGASQDFGSDLGDLGGMLDDTTGSVDSLKDALFGVRDAQKSHVDAMDGVRDAEQGVRDSEKDLAEAVKQRGEAQEEATRSVERARQSLASARHDEMRAAHELGEAQEDLAGKQRDYDEAIKDFGPNSKRAHDALEELQDAQFKAGDAQFSAAEAHQRTQDAARELTDAQADLNAELNGTSDAAERVRAAEDNVAEAHDRVKDANGALLDSTIRLQDALDDQKNALKDSGKHAQDLLDWLKRLQKKYPEIAQALQPLIDQLILLSIAQAQSGTGVRPPKPGSAPPIRMAAAGASVGAGEPVVVGERGWELFVPGTGGTIVNQDQLSRSVPFAQWQLGGGGQAIDYDRLASAVARQGGGLVLHQHFHQQISALHAAAEAAWLSGVRG